MTTELEEVLNQLWAELPSTLREQGPAAARMRLDELPVPLRRMHAEDAERDVLERVVAIDEARHGRHEMLVGILELEMVAGGPARALAVLYLASDEQDKAAFVARFALQRPDCAERRELERLLAQTAHEPAPWAQQIEELARDPTVEGWRDLFRFVPLDDFYHRARNAIAALDRLGVDPDTLFRLGTEMGTLPDAIGLVDTGRASPEVIAARGEGSPVRAWWLLLAARSALARSDRFATLRWARAAIIARAHEPRPELDCFELNVARLCDAADDELRGQLAAIGCHSAR